MLVFSGWGCITGLFLWAGTGAPCFRPGPAPGGLGSGGSEGDGDAPGCLVTRFGAAMEFMRLSLKYLEILKKKQ